MASVKDYVFVDGSWWLPTMNRKARDEYEKGPRITGAKFFDIDDVATKGKSSLPHMMPSPQIFGRAMDALGIQNDNKIVIYGQEGCPFLHRAWYTFRSLGHSKVQILNGSLQTWKANDGPLDTNPITAMRMADLTATGTPNYQASDPSSCVVSKQEVQDSIQSQQADQVQIVDVRPADRFYGRVEEPRPGLRLGHMPGAINLCFKELLKPQSTSLLESDNVLQSKLEKLMEKPSIIATCGSGATACVLAAAFYQLQADTNVRVYDGSWCEWGSDPNVPIVQD